MEPGAVVELWYVRGIEMTWFTTKIQAERAARRLYPNMTPEQLYMRVWCLRSEPHEEVI